MMSLVVIFFCVMFRSENIFFEFLGYIVNFYFVVNVQNCSFTFRLIMKLEGGIFVVAWVNIDKKIKIYILQVSNLSSRGRHFE